MMKPPADLKALPWNWRHESDCTQGLHSEARLVTGNPNCRTRSVIRHYEMLGGGPRPLRGPDKKNHFGFKNLSGLGEEATVGG